MFYSGIWRLANLMLKYPHIRYLDTKKGQVHYKAMNGKRYVNLWSVVPSNDIYLIVHKVVRIHAILYVVRTTPERGTQLPAHMILKYLTWFYLTGGRFESSASTHGLYTHTISNRTYLSFCCQSCGRSWQNWTFWSSKINQTKIISADLLVHKCWTRKNEEITNSLVTHYVINIVCFLNTVNEEITVCQVLLGNSAYKFI